MKKPFILFLALSAGGSLAAQDLDAVINTKEVERIEKIISSDDMQGRASFSPGIEKAADFICGEFKAAGLQTLNNSGSYRQTFTMVKAKPISTSGTFDGQALDEKNIIVFTTQADLTVNNQSGYEKAFIRKDDNIRSVIFKYIQADKDYLVLLDTSFAKIFPRLAGLKGQQFKSDHSVIFVLSTADPKQYEIHALHDITEAKLSNVVGILPGTAKKNEYVIFSAHYDHLGMVKPNAQHDSIYNGANDDASGSTAVILLAKYFAKMKNNTRTLLFVTFAAEEIGGFGSQYFSRQFDPAQVVAMFNIEMIGTESKWGTNSAYMTGYERTDMGKILEKNLAGSQFKFYPDPYPDQQLFFRSDNATLARQGVPAHSLSTSKMDSEKHYHQLDDEIGTLDMKNMTEIIRAIAISSKSIVDGNDTPTRVDTKDLK
ncbi:MAG TPA: M28 family peptidase [Puia sp.]|nr:M28 family peptidase [Puia sp.]